DFMPCLYRLVDHGYLRQLPPPPRSGPGQKPSPSFEIRPEFARKSPHNTQNSGTQGDSADSAERLGEIQDENEGGAEGMCWFSDCQEYSTPLERARARRDRAQSADEARRAAVNAQSAPTPPTRAERPLWTRRPPPELDDQEAERWDNARRHVDPEREE